MHQYTVCTCNPASCNPKLWSNTCEDREVSPFTKISYTHTTATSIVNKMKNIIHYGWMLHSHPVSVTACVLSMHSSLNHYNTYNPQCPHLVPVQEVCLKGLTQLLHYLLVAIESCKQNCSAAILREGCKCGLYIKWGLV